jgi:predicted RNase H-like HicB family nuclease
MLSFVGAAGIDGRLVGHGNTRAPAWSSIVITNYISEALHRARYSVVDGGVFCGMVPGLPGVIATAESLEACRDQLAEVVEEWVLVRVSRGLSVPRLGTARVQVRRAS